MMPVIVTIGINDMLNNAELIKFEERYLSFLRAYRLEQMLSPVICVLPLPTSDESIVPAINMRYEQYRSAIQMVVQQFQKAGSPIPVNPSQLK